MKTKTTFFLLLLVGAATTLLAIPMDGVGEEGVPVISPLRTGTRTTDAGERSVNSDEAGGAATVGTSDDLQQSRDSTLAVLEGMSTTDVAANQQAINATAQPIAGDGRAIVPIPLTLEDFRNALEAHPDVVRLRINDEAGVFSLQALNEDSTRGASRGENMDVTYSLKDAIATEHPEINVEDLFSVNAMTSLASYPSLSAEKLRAIFAKINPPVALSVPGSLVEAETISAEEIDESEDATTIPTQLANLYIPQEVAIAAELERQRIRFENRKAAERKEDEREQAKIKRPADLSSSLFGRAKVEADMAKTAIVEATQHLKKASSELSRSNDSWNLLSKLSNRNALQQAVERANTSFAEAISNEIDKNRIYRATKTVKSSNGTTIDQRTINDDLYSSWMKAEESFYFAINNLLSNRREQQAAMASWFPWNRSKSTHELDIIATETENSVQLAEAWVRAIRNTELDGEELNRAERATAYWSGVAIDARTTASRSAIQDEQEREAAANRRSPSNEREGDLNISESVLQDWRAATIEADNDDDAYVDAWTQEAKN